MKVWILKVAYSGSVVSVHATEASALYAKRQEERDPTNRFQSGWFIDEHEVEGNE